MFKLASHQLRSWPTKLASHQLHSWPTNSLNLFLLGVGFPYSLVSLFPSELLVYCLLPVFGILKNNFEIRNFVVELWLYTGVAWRLLPKDPRYILTLEPPSTLCHLDFSLFGILSNVGFLCSKIYLTFLSYFMHISFINRVGKTS